ncbi:MAG TPA: transposase [Polyangiaceae bacterium]|nr:transposase [Polyangiaceae bacterium]
MKYCEGKLSPTSIYGLLHRECHHLFPDDAFADLFQDIGRRSVPPRIVAVVMVLQRLEGLSDREAVDRFTFDVRWKYSAGGLDLEYPSFVHTVLVDMRARLRASASPDRIFSAVLDVAKQAGVVGRRRVLDSTPLYDAVATQDTVTMIRSAIRGLLRVATEPLATELRGALKRDDDYLAAGKPACDWDDKVAREALIDALARDAHAVLAHLDGKTLAGDVREAAALLATVVGQDLEQTEDGLFRIARRVAPDRVISTVDPEARHGHKTSARGFDGYKGHVAIDPDTEIITSAAVTAANVGDGSVAEELLSDVLPTPHPADPEAAPADAPGIGADSATTAATVDTAASAESEKVEVYGDASYGTAAVLERLDSAGAVANVKVQPPSPPREGLFSKDAFEIDTKTGTVRCPQGVLVTLRRSKDGWGHADFAPHCENCPLRSKCTTSKTGRGVEVHPQHDRLQRHRLRQRNTAWKRDYRATRPKVERKLAHLMRRKHGGRRARMRGSDRIGQDFILLCAATNLHRLAQLGLHCIQAGAAAAKA